ncbi:MAG: hypothetical protein RLZZ17_893 [Actinomycetota bacterium]|jgi:hypothetical protein
MSGHEHLYVAEGWEGSSPFPWIFFPAPAESSHLSHRTEIVTVEPRFTFESTFGLIA